MAERRMISKHIYDSDKFLDLPATSQLLYTHLIVHLHWPGPDVLHQGKCDCTRHRTTCIPEDAPRCLGHQGLWNGSGTQLLVPDGR